MNDASTEFILFTKEQQELYRNKLLQVKDFNNAFELVKMAVEARFKIHRAGIRYYRGYQPSFNYHILGSNMIIVNRRILDIIRACKSVEDYNSYLFMVLCHEYLHSFVITSELQVRKMTYDLCLSLFGESHLAISMARYGPWSVFPDLKLFQGYRSEVTFEIVKNFDKSTQSYIH